VVCNNQFKYNALKLYDSICKCVFNKIERPRYICCNYYKFKGKHFYIKLEKEWEMLLYKKKGYH